jgi:GMP synthase-like glutamine amidotransferase
MNPELIEKIESYKLDENTQKSTIRAFLNSYISAVLYDKIEGNIMEEKIEIVYNYLQNIDKEPIIPEVKQTLNIVIADDASSLDYVAYLKEKYEVTVHKVKDVTNPKDIDLVLFTGGEDVDPGIYNENVGKRTHINKSRDKKEMDTFYKFQNHSFMLGICRGSQLLTTLSGGKLIQHVEGHCRDHSMILNNTLRYNITSSHHQMLYPFNLNEKDYELIAYSEYFQSNTYLNGDNEEIELAKNFLEPEIIYYKNTNALCIQGHPEWNHCERRTSNMCLNLIDKYLKDFKKSKEEIVSNNPYISPYIQGSWNNTPYDENENHYEEDHQDYYEEGKKAAEEEFYEEEENLPI